MVTQIVRGQIDIDGIQFEQRYKINATKFALVFDSETHVDISQRARLGIYALINYVENDKNNISYVDRGMVSYDLTTIEDERLKEYCRENNVRYMTKNDFITKMLYPSVERGIMLIGHNIVFDIGAIATHFEVNFEKEYFCFKMCTCNESKEIAYNKIVAPCEVHPNIIIKYVKTRKYLMYFENDNYGSIADTGTIGNALLGTGKSSLNDMIVRYGYEDEKEKISSYGEEYTEKMYSYAFHDVTLTSKLLLAEYELYKKHDISIEFSFIMSEASIGKAYNSKLGIEPFKKIHPEVKYDVYKYANYALFGGRSETYTRRIPTLGSYVDFKSEYPLVNSLLHLQDYMLARYLVTERCVNEVKEFFEKILFEDLKYKETWLKLPVLVQIKTNGDLLPYRTDKNSFEYRIQSNSQLWYSLCDVIASYILTGKKPKVVDAIRLVPHGKIETNIIKLFGDDNFVVDLSKDDFFTKVIDLRDSVKREIKELKVLIKTNPDNKYELIQRKIYLDNMQLALKLMANSTSYGILVETREYNRLDYAGKYNALPIGTHITAGGRLLLAIAQKLGKDKGIEHVLCDTDSFFYGKPDTMDKEIFYEYINEIIAWFNNLSPFASSDAIFELEDYNYYNGKREDLYAYAISSKRYSLYNHLENNKKRIRKLSQHGIQNYQINIDTRISEDIEPIPLNENSKRVYYPDKYSMWYRGIEQVEKGLEPDFSMEECLQLPAIKQQAITSLWHIRNYSDIPDIRPFCFFSETQYSKNNKDGDRYYMPFFDVNKYTLEDYLKKGVVKKRGTNEVVYAINIDTLKDRYNGFFTHIESKFENGSQDGIMKRKSVDNAIIEQRTRSGKKIIDTDNSNQMELW